MDKPGNNPNVAHVKKGDRKVRPQFKPKKVAPVKRYEEEE